MYYNEISSCYNNKAFFNENIFIAMVTNMIIDNIETTMATVICNGNNNSNHNSIYGFLLADSTGPSSSILLFIPIKYKLLLTLDSVIKSYQKLALLKWFYL